MAAINLEIRGLLMKNLFVFITLSLFFTHATLAKDLVRSGTVDDNPIVGSLLNALGYAQELDEPQSAEQLLNRMLVVVALAQAGGDALSEDAERRALSILSAISNEVTAASNRVDETLASRIMRTIEVVSASVAVDRTPPDDVTIEGSRAERIIREGSTVANDTYISEDITVIRYLLVNYRDNLYACVHRHSPDVSERHRVIDVSCSREGEDD